MAAQLRKVNATTPTALVLRDDVRAVVMPIYEDLARDLQRAEHRKQPTRPAWRRWKSRIAPLLKRLDAEPNTPPDGPVAIRPLHDHFAAD